MKKNKLRNIKSKADCLKDLEKEKFKRITISFYKFVDIKDPKWLRDQLFLVWRGLGVLGRIYVGKVGINAQLNVPEHNLEAFRASVDLIPEFRDVMFKFALEEPNLSFWKLTIKVREQIVAHGIEEEIDMSQVGEHVDAVKFNELLENGATVVDMRNGYESKIGHFEGAICPDADTFREEIPMAVEMLKGKEDEPVLLYCTGGIRCEPFSAYLKQKGFKKVHQLNGGIIQYAHEIKEKNLPSKFVGKNFVFDARLAETVTDDVLSECYNCGTKCDTYVDCASDLCHALFIQCDDCQKKMSTTCSVECKNFAELPDEERRKLRKGRKAKFLIHSK
jgi:UPF0176 protein